MGQSVPKQYLHISPLQVIDYNEGTNFKTHLTNTHLTNTHSAKHDSPNIKNAKPLLAGQKLWGQNQVSF
ncbi:hypothetical protein EGC79_20350 [Shewanella vesiculosa]|nr:hypothetical protein EGC79_20350 [Shewanella vesiculosa]